MTAESTAVKPVVQIAGPRPIWFQLALALICIVLYANTLSNKYCLDDAMMITNNEITQKGFGGIREHVEHSFLYGFMHREGYDAASSHWRPLVMISFAVEIGLWGADKPGYSHAVNLLIYIILVISLFGLLRKYLLKNTWLSFIATLLFAIHPLHTEVVANIKGRDEMICLLFLLFSLHQLWRFMQSKKPWHYLLSLILFFLSMTAKENSLTFLAGIPLMLYFFSGLKGKTIAWYSAGFAATTLVFIMVRNALVPLSHMVMSDEITNNPYLYAQGSESLATKIYVLLKFLKMLVWPYPLSYDYSYNQVPYVGFSEPLVWISLLAYGSLFLLAAREFRARTVLSFSILMFFITFSVSTNLVVETGVMMAERMMFTPSIFAMLALTASGERLAALLEKRAGMKKGAFAAAILIPVMIASSWMVINRNKDWKDDATLNLADVAKNPNSVRVNGGAGTACLTLADDPSLQRKAKDSLLRQAVSYYSKSASIHPGYNDAILNMGVAYIRMDSLFKAEECWNRVRKNNPASSKLAEFDRYMASTFYNMGISAESRSLLDSAMIYYQKTEAYSRQNDTIKLGAMYNLAGCHYRRNEFRASRDILQRLLSIYPNYKQAQQGILACDHFIQLEDQQKSKLPAAKP